MKKTFKFATLVLLALFSLALAGCGNSADDSAALLALGGGGTGSGGGNGGGNGGGGETPSNSTKTTYTINGTAYTVQDGKVTVTKSDGTKEQVGTVDNSGVITITQGGQTITVTAQGSGSSNVTVTIATTDGSGATTTKTYAGDITSGTLTNTQDESDTITITKTEETTPAPTPTPTPGATYTVTFNTDGGSVVSSQSVASGATATKPGIPTKTDCAFVCWFKDGALFDFATPITGNVELTAKWYTFQTTVKELPAGTKGTGNPDGTSLTGTTVTYVLFGDYPQKIKEKTVTVDKTREIKMGGLTYYPGSDGNLYAEGVDRAFWKYHYSDGTKVGLWADWDSGNGTINYFKVEPIKWRVWSEDYGNGHKKMLVAENVLTNYHFSTYHKSTDTREINGKTIYGDNWEYSDLRDYLNGTSVASANCTGKGFLQTAFTESAQGLIATTTVDNTVYYRDGSVVPDNELYGHKCDDTQDRIFVLSSKEINAYTPYDKKYEKSDSTRIHTDWSLSNCGQNGSAYNPLPEPDSRYSDYDNRFFVQAYQDFETYGPLANYWTRTPRVANNTGCMCIGRDYLGYGTGYGVNLGLSVVPALCLK
ncbi:MAG: InlB B-repeat-containing protein [Treponema sp.]|nr:InlB B-repeat-containing protein [Treponema sp.]